MFISIISPVYKAEGMIDLLTSRLHTEIQKITAEYEIILVDDGSPDLSWNEMVSASSLDRRVKAIKLSRNFGQHYAITAGIDHSTGEWVVVMDCDLQDRPEEIPALLEKAKEGFDIVLAARRQKTFSWLKKVYSKLFYKILSWLTGVKYDHGLANFGIYHRKAIVEITKMRESIRCFPIMVQWIGFRKGIYVVKHDARAIGKSTYDFKRLVNLAIDIMLAYSDKPLRLTVKLGLVISVTAFLFTAYYIYKYFNGEILVPGYASLIISIWFLSGILIFILGIVGLYIGKTFEGVKHRPLYIVQEIVQTEAINE